MNTTYPGAKPGKIEFVMPSLKDPRLTLLIALSTWTLLGQKVLYFNRITEQIALTLVICTLLDIILGLVTARKILVPLSGAITGLSLGILLESYDTTIFIVASIWAILSKHLIQVKGRHLFNPSNFGVVAILLLSHGMGTVTPGSQWGGDFRYAVLIFTIGMVMMWRVKRLSLVTGWLAGYVLMGLIRMAVGQGGLVFVLGPMTGAEFTLFTFSMIPDPKTSPSENASQVKWGLAIGVLDGILRLMEFRFSMFYALFVLCAIRPWFGAINEKCIRWLGGANARALSHD
jgi:Na+-transporting NADH:ubiquinone oxidoreductase subunit NqrB